MFSTWGADTAGTVSFLRKNGFELETVDEAEPPEEMMDIPGMKDELRRPMMLLVKAIRKTELT